MDAEEAFLKLQELPVFVSMDGNLFNLINEVGISWSKQDMSFPGMLIISVPNKVMGYIRDSDSSELKKLVDVYTAQTKQLGLEPKVKMAVDNFVPFKCRPGVAAETEKTAGRKLDNYRDEHALLPESRPRRSSP